MSELRDELPPDVRAEVGGPGVTLLSKRNGSLKPSGSG